MVFILRIFIINVLILAVLFVEESKAGFELYPRAESFTRALNINNSLPGKIFLDYLDQVRQTQVQSRAVP